MSRRQVNKLSSLPEAELLQPNSKAWLTRSLATFPDSPVPDFLGVPGVNTSNNVCYNIKQTVNIAAPAAVTPGNAWDANVYMSPVLWQCQPGQPRYLEYGVYCAAPGSVTVPPIAGGLGASTFVTPGLFGGARMDGLVVSTVPSGFETFSYNAQYSGITLDTYLTPLVNSTPGETRLLRVAYSGFEVINTTPVIQMGGQVVLYESADVLEETLVNKLMAPSGTVTDKYASTATTYRLPCSTVQAAMQAVGSAAWGAAEGAYVSAKFTELPTYQAVDAQDYLFTVNSRVIPNSATVLASSVMNFGAGLKYFSTLPLSGQDIRPAIVHYAHNEPGAYFSGLPYDTTLQVVWHLSYELLPSANDVANLALARQPALYDAKVFELYLAVAAHLPIGAPRNFNDLGKWMSMVGEAIKKALPHVYNFIPILAKIIGGPTGAGIAAAGVAAQALGNALGPLIKGGLTPEERDIRSAQSKRDKASQNIATRVIKRAVANKGSTGLYKQNPGRGK